MKPRLLLNLALAALVVVLVLLGWLKPGLKKPAAPVPLTGLKATDIHHIKIAAPGQATAELVRTADGWQLTSPVHLPADTYLVKQLLGEMDEQTHGGFAAASAKLGGYGLAPPKLQLWLNGMQLDFGSTEPLNDYRYVKIGDRIELSTGLLFFRTYHAPLWWANKQLLPAGTRIIAIQLPNASLTLKDGKWQLQPSDPEISADAIQSLVNAWQSVAAISVVPLDKRAPEKGEVAVALADHKEPLRFTILMNPNFLVLARPDLGVEYQLDSDQRNTLLKLTRPAKTTPEPKTRTQ